MAKRFSASKRAIGTNACSRAPAIGIGSPPTGSMDLVICIAKRGLIAPKDARLLLTIVLRGAKCSCLAPCVLEAVAAATAAFLDASCGSDDIKTKRRLFHSAVPMRYDVSTAKLESEMRSTQI